MPLFTSEFVGGPKDGDKRPATVPPQDRDELVLDGHVYRFQFSRGAPGYVPAWVYVGPVEKVSQ